MQILMAMVNHFPSSPAPPSPPKSLSAPPPSSTASLACPSSLASNASFCLGLLRTNATGPPQKIALASTKSKLNLSTDTNSGANALEQKPNPFVE
ncbi:hypothetical protein PtA15_11A116 [Puccinia triticina]|uniref:Uncharacterized protein n=1 Tax=Puccinia triticina TaxID=208348 RepID=A0ABY7CYK2_9BASI|nr:uncharacterized protein PtA15_11A116 [Puccinia triticina]WAQ89428.1 hypothetical protein PtA15_11A116 [Puccinia triticina]